MISFKDFLTESREAYLYHGAPLWNASAILRDDVLKSNTWNSAYGGWGISTARTIQAVEWFIKNEKEENLRDTLIFVLDKNKLRHNYRVVPYDYFMDSKADPLGVPGHVSRPQNRRKEAEEFILTKGPNVSTIPLSKYLVKVLYYGKDVEDFLQLKYPHIKREKIK